MGWKLQGKPPSMTRAFSLRAQIPIPSVPTFQPSTPVPERLEAVQRYIRELQYPPWSESQPLSGWSGAGWGLFPDRARGHWAEQLHPTTPGGATHTASLNPRSHVHTARVLLGIGAGLSDECHTCSGLPASCVLLHVMGSVCPE